MLTDASGDYSFNGANITSASELHVHAATTAACPLLDGLPPGLYQISETNLFGYQSIADADGGNPDSISLVLASGQSKTGQDFEDRLVKAAIGNFVWLDVDGDGVQDVGEPGLPNVTVRLYHAGPNGVVGGGDDVLVATQLTDANGNYLFDGIGVGTYFVDVDQTTLPANLATAPGTTDPSALVAITQAEQILSADFGYVSADPNKAIIGDRIWADANANGVQDPSEVGIAGVTVALKNLAGATIATTTTGVSGSYLFTNVDPGTYVVAVDTSGPLAGYTVTSGPQSEGADTSAARTVIPGDIRVDVDFGYNAAGTLYSITDRLWFDLNADGSRRGRERAGGSHRQSARRHGQSDRDDALGRQRQRHLHRRARRQLRRRRVG